MHKHTIDWIRQVELTADVGLAEKHWQTANKLAENLTRPRIIELLRLFLFPTSGTDFTKTFTDELVDLDPEFRISDNIQYLRLIAGLTMVTIFNDSSDAADAFALGIRAASFPAERVKPVIPAIVGEAEHYMLNEAGRCRPDNFAAGGDQVVKTLTARSKAVTDAQGTGDLEKIKTAETSFRTSVINTIAGSHSKLGARLHQLAEETGLLWWVFNEYSDSLESAVSKLAPQAYALAAASEAAERTQILPPPPCIGPLLARALRNCRAGKKNPVLADYLEAADADWCANHVKTLMLDDCYDLVPFSAAIKKTVELGDSASALKSIPKLCPGVSTTIELSSLQVAQQFYNELVFLRALSNSSS